jgi:hypothetical protein
LKALANFQYIEQENQNLETEVNKAKNEIVRIQELKLRIPSLEDEMTDIHEDKRFKVKEFCVTREGKSNVLVSPYYFISGGTVIDWWREEEED